MAKITITPELISDLKKFGNQFCVGVATKVRDKLCEDTVSSLGAFYSSYSPSVYQRHYFNFMDNSWKPYYQNAHGGIVRGGVELSSSSMSEIYKQSAATVFESVYSGEHGYQSYKNTSPNTEAPMKMIEDSRNKIISGIYNYTSFGFSRAKSQSYSTIHC